MITSPDTSTDLFCRLDSPIDRPNGGEDDKTSLEAHPDETEGDINVVDDEAQDRTDQAPSYYNDESNENHADPGQPPDHDAAYQEQLNDAHEIEGDVIDNVVDDETQNKTDQGETYQEQLNDGPFDHRTDNTDNHFVEETVETYPNHVELVNKSLKASKPASYYGDGWEESSPPPSLATQLQQRQRTAPPVPTRYPHILDIIPHWTQFADPNAKKDVPFCKQLAQGGCSQDDKCRFRHSLTVEEYVLLFNDQQPNLWTLEQYDVNEAPISFPSCEPQADSLDSWSSTVVPKSSIFGQECKFYPIGKCRNGGLCPFPHTQHPPVPATTVSNADQISERPVFGTQNSQRPCKFYAERGYCSRGVSCKFRHDHPNDDRPSEPSGPESSSAVDDGKGWSTTWGEGNQANNNISDPDTPEDDGWGAAGAAAATGWEALSTLEDRSAWDNPGMNEDSHKSRPRNSNLCFQYPKGLCNRGMTCKFSHDQESNKQLSSEAPKADDGGWPPTDDCHPASWSTVPEARSTWGTEGELKTLSENQQEQGFQDSNIIDNETTWSQPWTETVQPPSFPKKIDAPCMRFGQGYCPRGDDCNYLHIEDTDSAECTINSEENNSVRMSLNRCTLSI